MQISMKSDLKELTKELEVINKKAIPKATVQAINKTATGTKTDSVRLLSKEASAKQKEVRSGIRVTKANKNRMFAEVDATEAKAKNLIHFVSPSRRKANHFNQRTRKGKYKYKGVKAKAWGENKTYEGTFIGKGRGSGKLLVFARKGKGRKPLKSIRGPSIRNIFKSKPVQSRLKQLAAPRFVKAMTAAVNNQIRIHANK